VFERQSLISSDWSLGFVDISKVVNQEKSKKSRTIASRNRTCNPVILVLQPCDPVAKRQSYKPVTTIFKWGTVQKHLYLCFPIMSSSNKPNEPEITPMLNILLNVDNKFHSVLLSRSVAVLF
jgi:hypothetical protein